jgi:glycosyltransferase involved in cell wall biosynthesis
MPKRKIVIVSTSPFPHSDNITDGPGYRAWNLFQRIPHKHEIVILSLYESFHKNIKKEFTVFEENYQIKGISHKPGRVAKAVYEEKPDVLYLPWSATPFIARIGQRIPTIMDYVGATLLEQFITFGIIPYDLLRLKMKSFWIGDFFITAGSRERYYLMGLLVGSKRLCTPSQKLASSLIHLVPMTPPSVPPVLQKKVIEKKSDERVILVAGALLPWYDYSTLFEALDILVKQERTNFKCVFFGGNPRNLRFERLIRKMGGDPRLKDNLVFTGTVPFKERGNYYLQSDVAVNIPLSTVEDELSVRTRIMDYIWAELPLITPATDEHSKMIIDNGGGFEYDANDPASLSRVLQKLMSEQGLRELENSRKSMERIYKKSLDIEEELKPLEAFINEPYVDPARSSPRQYLPEILLWGRDVMRWLKRGVV